MADVLGRLLTSAAGAAALAVLCAPVAGADPEPAPPAPPNAATLTPTSPVDYIVNDGVYAFSAPIGVNCVMSKNSRSYGCSGNLPGAPGGANVVTGGPGGEPGFSVTDRPLYAFNGPPRELPEGSRLGQGTVSCGVLAGGVVCTNSYDQSGFVIAPGGSYAFGAVNPLLDRPRGTNPFAN
ncbi:hypothetical protein MFAL_21870 [Mycolicibacterium fallax]|nr:hypothetical protein MFAL_21870 [Mycolicibacterium fallax]